MYNLPYYVGTPSGHYICETMTSYAYGFLKNQELMKKKDAQEEKQKIPTEVCTLNVSILKN